MSNELASIYLKEMGISQWSLRDKGPSFTPQASTGVSESQVPNTQTPAQAKTILTPKVYWLFYGKAPSGDTELLFQNIVRALGLVQGEWEWREPSNTKEPDTPLPCIAFAFGADAAQLLSGEREPLENLRDVVLELGGLDIPLVASFDLSHLLQKPNDKALAWQDLLLARSVLQSL
jgi:DNA polymerase